MNYMGSKSKIAKHIVPILQSYIDKYSITTYIEPFVGGANIIDKIKCPTRIGTDNNKYVIALLQRVQSGKPLLSDVSKLDYYKAKRAYETNDNSEFEDWQIANIGFLASYNGRFFEGYVNKGIEHSRKRGDIVRYYYEEHKNNLLKQAANFDGILFQYSDYKAAETAFIPHKTLIYCDPPYENSKKYRTSCRFDYDIFWNIMRKWSVSYPVFISAQEAPPDFKCVWEKEVSRSIRAEHKKRAIEKLFILQGGIANE